jgi:hypothetical protein
MVLPADVALYREASQVPRHYEEVALLNSSGDSEFTNEHGMFQSMKKEAGKLGANAVILDALSEPSGGAKVAAAIFGVSAQRKGKALAIYVLPAQTVQKPIPVSTNQSVQASGYEGAPKPAAIAELAKLGCANNFGLLSESDGRSIFEGTCMAGKRQLMECWMGVCRAMN